MQIESPLISIIIPVYNVEKYVTRCLDSIIKQTYSKLEIIVVDDGSTDSSGRICDEYKRRDERINVIHKSNGGLSDARNVGIDEACGEYISFVDSDDWVTNDYIDSMYRVLVANACDIVICGSRNVSEEDVREKKTKEKSKVCFNGEAVKQLLYQRISTSAYGKLYKFDLWNDVRFQVGKLYEDVEPVYMVFQKSKKVIMTNKCNYYYFHRPESIVNQKFSIKKMDYVKNCRKVLEDVKKNYPQYENAAISRLMWAEIHVLMHMDNPKDYPYEYKLLMCDIRKYRWKILKDKQNKLKNRVVASLSIMGYKAMRIVFKITQSISS